MAEDCLIFLAHGSPRPQWKKPLEELVADIRAQLLSQSCAIAYLQTDTPTLEDVIKTRYREGCRSFKILPLFLSDGHHIAKGLEQRLADLKLELQNCTFTTLPPLVRQPLFRKLILDLAGEHK